MTGQENITLRIPGVPLAGPGMPRALGGAARGTGAGPDPFLPEGYVEVVEAFDVSPAARAVPGEAATMVAQAGEVLVLELDDGVSVFVSPENLQRVLDCIDPGSGEGGALDLEALRRHGAVSRGLVGDAVGSLVRRVFRLRVGTAVDPVLEAARRKLAEWLGAKAESGAKGLAELGVTWLGTRALMWAVESRLQREPGLYRWVGARGEPTDLLSVGDARLEAEARQGPLLVFIHGTGSNSTGSFGDLQSVSKEDWRTLQAKFGERIFAFEHRTFSESPIENALALARVLPRGAQIGVVTHSRGGLVGDFLCLERVDSELADRCFGTPEERPGEDAEQRATRLARTEAYAEHRARLAELGAVLREKQFVVERYVRVASPARGTRLASANLDVFLSGLLSLIGMVPALAGNPIYGAVKRIVLEIARNRTRPDVVPGIEAMLPDSPTAAFLARSSPRTGMALAVIAGDIEGGGILKKLGVLFTDHVFFDGVDNDLVVDTDSMYAGLARPGSAYARFEQGPKVNHFRYFENADSRSALVEWLTCRDLAAVTRFDPLPANPAERTVAREIQDDQEALRLRGGDRAAAAMPVVIVLPGIMGSHLQLRSGSDRVWFDPLDLVRGGLAKLSWKGLDDDVRAEKLFDRFYGDLCTYLLSSHRVERFPYDWRKPVRVAAEELARRVSAVLDATEDSKVPVRLLAHSMGGLVVRTMIAAHPGLWDRLNAREGARFVMLGTPNQGSHSMVATLLGKDDTVRKLARFVDMKHDLQELLDIIKGFRGALQLLPRPGFVDVAGAENQSPDYYAHGLWEGFRAQNRDFWFGNGVVGAPADDALDEARAIWQDSADLASARLPQKHRERIVYVCGHAELTPCGLRLERGRWKMLATAEGDGTVTWQSGLIEGLEKRRNVFYMRAEHGALADTQEAFPALVDLLNLGDTQLARVLSKDPPAVRALAGPVAYEPGPTPYPDADEVANALLGSRRPKRTRPTPRPTLSVGCSAMDLRQAVSPVMVGHYEQDAISGAEALIDREVVGSELTMRNHLGLYAGRLGTATVVLQPRNEEERRRGSARGAVVVGMGELGKLSVGTLTEAVRTGVLRYLLQVVDNQGGSRAEVGAIGEVALTSLLLGHNSTTNISIEDSVGAIVRGVLEANQEFVENMKWPLRVTRLDLVELYLDTAISATRALQRVADRLNDDVSRYGMRVAVDTTLTKRQGWRHRLDAQESSAYWPRMIVTDAHAREDGSGVPGPAVDAAGGVPRTRLAQDLKFLYLGQRARAESVLQQRQPGLVETLVAESISRTAYSEDFSRTLFQLLVPNDFKEVARQLGQIVLVVDRATANLPWELMLADTEPLAIQMRMVRQLASGRFRTRVRQTLDPLAYVVGNPGTEGFGKVFVTEDGRPYADPPPLAGAEAEARAAVRVLAQAGFHVTECIGQGCSSLEIINKLYRQHYRIVHIAAHGVFEQRAADGSLRTGAVLSGGVLLTAAEIEAMEIVPDLVFLNCCHLAQTDGAGPEPQFNRLAYSVARQLIEMGVRAVVAAGWAVDDEAAETFAAEFYDALLRQGRTLGDAAFQARRSVYERFGATTNTWGAYQIYGDPGYLVDPLAHEKQAFATRATRVRPVAVDELVGALERIAHEVSGIPGALAPEAAVEHAKRADRLLADCPPAWRERPDVNYALGHLYGSLGAAHFDEAREHFLRALRSTDREHVVPTRTIEELANLEARVAEEREAQAAQAAGASLALVDSAIRRLDELGRIAGERPFDLAPDRASPDLAPPNPERAILFGSAWKRRAAVLAWRLLRGRADADRDVFHDALGRAADAYRVAAARPDDSGYRPYMALNVLALRAALDAGRAGSGRDTGLAEARAEVRTCRERAWQAYRDNPDFWNAVMPADAAVVEGLLTGMLGAEGQAGDGLLAEIQAVYREALRSARGTPRDLDSVARQWCLLSLFYRVQSQGAGRRDAGAAALRTAERLQRLANFLLPDTCRVIVDPAGPGGGEPPSSPPAGGAAAKRRKPRAKPAGKVQTKSGSKSKRKPTIG